MTAQKSQHSLTIFLVGVTLLVLGSFALSHFVYAADDVLLVSEDISGVVDQITPVVADSVSQTKAVAEVVPSVIEETATVGGSVGGSASTVLAADVPEVVSVEVTASEVPVVTGAEVVSEEVGNTVVPSVNTATEMVSSEVVATTSTGGGGGNPQPTPFVVISAEVTAVTAVVNTGDVVISEEVSATTYGSTIPPPGSDVVSDEVTARTSDAPSGCTSNCGGGGSPGGGGSSGGGGSFYTPTPVVEEELTTCSEYLLEYIRLGWDNNPLEVLKLQVFLNQFEGFNLPLTGVYTQADFEAVSIFQARYGRDILGPWGIVDSTGFVFITTKMAINNIVCHLSTENNLDLRNFYYREAARLGFHVPTGPSPIFVPVGVATSTATSTWLGRFQAAMVGLFNYFQNNGGWRVIGFLLILAALFILIWRLSRNVLEDDFDGDNDLDGGRGAAPLLLPPVFFDENKEDKDEFALVGDELEEVVIPSEEEELGAVAGEEAPAADEPLSEYGQRPLDNLS